MGVELRGHAHKLRERMKDLDVTEISRDINDAEKAQNGANDQLETSSRDADATKHHIKQITDKLDDVESKLGLTRRPQTLLDDIKGLKRKTEQNRQQAREAATDTTDTQPEVEEVEELFEELKRRKENQTDQDEAEEKLRSIVDEAQKLKTDVEEKLRLIEDVEKKIQQQIISKQQKVEQVENLLKTVDSLRQEISKRAEGYISCTS